MKGAKRAPSAKRRRPSLAKMRPIILRIAKEYGATNVRIFGSFARGEERKSSDVDLLVDLPKKASILDISCLKVDLEEALEHNVDVLTDDGINSYLQKNILSEARPL